MVSVRREHIQIVQGARGPKPRIVGSRIRVQDITISHEQLRMFAAEIVRELPSITLADVYAALAYYWDHREEIEGVMAAERAYVEAFRRQYPGRLQERLMSDPR
jgi:uncharacterized protein (DUF433 family)